MKHLTPSNAVKMLVTSGLFAFITPFVANSAIDTDSEQVTRLDLQGQIDTNAPFSKTLWAGAHNAYASFSWDKGIYTDVNQYYSPKSLLKRGIRAMEFDIYPETTLDSTPMLCHNNREKEALCSSTYHAKLSDGLDDIKAFLDENPDEVVLLKIEAYKSIHHDNWHNKIGERLQKDIGDYLLVPADWGYEENNCASLPVNKLTKKDILASGKQIVAVIQTPRDAGNLCTYHDHGSYGKFFDTVFIGVDTFDENGDLQSNQPFCQNNSNGCTGTDKTTHYQANNMSVVIDDATQLNPDGPASDKTGSKVISNWANKDHKYSSWLWLRQMARLQRVAMAPMKYKLKTMFGLGKATIQTGLVTVRALMLPIQFPIQVVQALCTMLAWTTIEIGNYQRTKGLGKTVSHTVRASAAPMSLVCHTTLMNILSY
ncbi:phosphatidylinositol-specific phospholipase C domain-containing protein [Pseudoalteromonas xiamenensis]|uniref:phosphatidylinositol-specific phospholipase C domain-containing protein n=1 Tax=Pseudoalteromonas xiamenensis TaxID=882626 RepID=UPI001FCAD88F|nr:phosphatidylinositol-specific phospholipase C domain-containing protein [Pseudoalteromonas xiamenensis]